MPNSTLITACLAVLAFVLGWVITGLVLRYALRHAMLDIPNARSSHEVPTARGGGLSIVVTFVGALIVLLCTRSVDLNTTLALVAGGSAIALVGYMDDRRTLPASMRILVHLMSAALAVFLVGGIAEPTLGHLGLHGVWAGRLLGVAVIAWSINLFNFMDGIDGIAGSEAVFVSGAGALFTFKYAGDWSLSGPMLILAASSLGFLIWNWPPARIFMGDVGSGFLGFTLAVLGLAANRHASVPIEIWAILSGVFLVDATVTLMRRIVRGDRWFEAHRLHAYQALASRWRSHLPVTTGVIAINLIWLLPWAWAAAASPAHALRYVAFSLLPLALAAFLIGAGRNRT